MLEPDEIDVREAVLDDAAACAGVHVRSWKATYSGMIADEYLDDLTAEDRLGAWESWLAEPKTRGCVLLVEHRDRIQGFGSFVAHGTLGPRWAYIPNLYLDPSAIGRGWGRALMQAGLDRLTTFGYDHAELWTHIDNRRAQRFYEIGGWTHDGARRTEKVWDLQMPEMRYTRALHP